MKKQRKGEENSRHFQYRLAVRTALTAGFREKPLHLSSIFIYAGMTRRSRLRGAASGASARPALHMCGIVLQMHAVRGAAGLISPQSTAQIPSHSTLQPVSADTLSVGWNNSFSLFTQKTFN